MNKTTKTIWCECSRLLRGTLRRELRQGAYMYGLDAQIEEDFGLLAGTIYVTLTGEPTRIQQYICAIIEMVQNYNEEDEKDNMTSGNCEVGCQSIVEK